MASRKEEKERRRRERLEREHAEREQAKRRRIYATAAGSVLVLAAVAAVAVAIVAGAGGGDDGSKDFPVEASAPPAQRVSVLADALEEAGCRVRNPAIEGRTHVTTKVKYGTNPPTSGNHNPVPAEDGAYGESPPIQRLVHALEHGRIIVWYKPTTRRQSIAQLKGLYDEDPYHMLLVPHEQMPFAVAATAWGHLMGCRRISDETFDALRAFRDRYRDKGPEFVP